MYRDQVTETACDGEAGRGKYTENPAPFQMNTYRKWAAQSSQPFPWCNTAVGQEYEPVWGHQPTSLK